MRTQRDGNMSSKFPFLWRNGSHGWDCHQRIKAGPHLFVVLAPFLGGSFVRSFVCFFILKKCYSLNSVTRLMEWRIEWTTLPCFVPMNKKLASLLFTGTFWLSWRPWVYGYCRVSVQMSETLFETKPFISRYVGKRVRYHLWLWRKFLSYLIFTLEEAI